MRNLLEAFISKSLHVPMVLLVVQGGPGTLATVLSAAFDATPIVVLADSGGAASAIYQYCKFGLGAVEEKFRSSEHSLQQLAQLNRMVKLPNTYYHYLLLTTYYLPLSLWRGTTTCFYY